MQCFFEELKLNIKSNICSIYQFFLLTGKPGENALGNVCAFVCLSVCVSAQTKVECTLQIGVKHAHYQSYIFVCVSIIRDTVKPLTNAPLQ